MVIQQKSGNTLARSPLQLLGSRLLHLFPTEKFAPQTFFVHQSSLSLYMFQVPLFYASLPDDPLMPVSFFSLFHLYLYQPLKPNMLQKIHFPFFYFLAFFRKSECSFRISYFHMYAATLIPFSSQNISFTFLSAHTLVSVEQHPLLSYQTIKK